MEVMGKYLHAVITVSPILTRLLHINILIPCHIVDGQSKSAVK